MVPKNHKKHEEKPSDKTSCALCEEKVLDHRIVKEALVFCCHGCLAVYEILKAKDVLEEKLSHPLFQKAVDFGLISNPGLLEKLKEKEGKNPQHKTHWTFSIEGMWCPSCAEFLQLIVGSLKGVVRCRVDYMTDLAVVDFDPLITSKEKIKEHILSSGYTPIALEEMNQEKDTGLVWQIAIALFSAFNIMMFTYPLYATFFDLDAEGLRPILAWISLILTLPALFYSAKPIYKRFYHQIRHGWFATEGLAVIGILASFLLSLIELFRGTYHVYFDSIAVLIAFLLIGKWIEKEAKFSTKNALRAIHLSLPKRARKKVEGKGFIFVPLKEVKPKDLLLVAQGEKIALDGRVIEGEGAVDESALTGESTLVKKNIGDPLISGTIVVRGSLVLEVLQEEKGSTLFRLVNLLEKEVGEKSHYVRSGDRIARVFTPLTMIFALFTALFSFVLGVRSEEIFLRTLAIFLMACPCAIGIAAPLVEAKMVEMLTLKGAILRNRAALALLQKVTHFVFDKTGTITKGKFTILSTCTLEQKRLLKGLCLPSCHPVSLAISQGINEEPFPFDRVEEILGRGMRGVKDGKEVFLGSQKFARELGLDIESREETNPFVFLFDRSTIFLRIELGDAVRSGVKWVLENLPGKKLLLSGDQVSIVKALAEKYCFDEWYGEMSPLEKGEVIAKIKNEGGVVCMVGDGINDAHALAKADVGVSVVSATDLSIQVSDLLFTKEDLSLLVEFIEISKRGERLIRQNLFFAFFYNAFGLLLAATGFLTPLFASFAMIASSLMVIGNASRLTNRGLLSQNVLKASPQTLS